MKRYICIHGHFYQPPRENPWLEEIEFQDSAYPYHDWNERITAECYAPNTASRMLDKKGRIIDIVNNYSKISFNFGPTLLSWMEKQSPIVYEAILEADELSMEKFSGHGSAIAQAYNHVIMPLANRRDKHTQVYWGVRDFQKRFKRDPEGMWLPETAVDTETLEVLVSFGIKFTILSPRQASRMRAVSGSEEWQDVSGERIDPTRGYLCPLPSGRTITIFFYDGPISQEISFGGLLKNGEVFAGKLLAAFNEERTWPQLVHVATDGETYGHHHRHGEMALSYALNYIESNNLAKITNYSQYLEMHPPSHVVEIFENSSWSCVHGVERWKDDCGCNSGLHQGWTQAWRKPLRAALDWLRDELIRPYGHTASQYLSNAWDARNEYISVILDRSDERIEQFFRKHAVRALTRQEQEKVIKLLELQRNAMLMYTSCGWFFDEVSGIETMQILQYASMVLQHGEEVAKKPLEKEFLTILRTARSNVFKHAAEAYERHVHPGRIDLLRVGAHYCISSIFEDFPTEIKLYCYQARSHVYDKMEAGRLRMAVGSATIRSEITWEESEICFAVLHLGDHNLNAGVHRFKGEKPFSEMRKNLKGAFERGDVPEVVRLMDKHFDGKIYSLWHLFRDEQRKLLNEILQLTYEGVEASYRQIFETNYAIMNYYHRLQHRLPRPLRSAAEYIVNTDLNKIFHQDTIDVEKLAKSIEEVTKWSLTIDRTFLSFTISSWVNGQMEQLGCQPVDLELFEEIDTVLRIIEPLSLSLNLWSAQNIYFDVSKNLCDTMRRRLDQGDSFARRWFEVFDHVGAHLQVKV